MGIEATVWCVECDATFQGELNYEEQPILRGSLGDKIAQHHERTCGTWGGHKEFGIRFINGIECGMTVHQRVYELHGIGLESKNRIYMDSIESNNGE